MAKAKSGDSKQGLIITLVIFVILSIGLGVTAYFGFDGQQALDSQRKASEDKLKSMTKSRDWEQYKARLLKAYAGFASKDDLEGLAASRDARSQIGQGEPDKADFDQMVQKLDGATPKERDAGAGLGWDDSQKKPKTTYKDELVRLNGVIKGLQGELQKEKDDSKDTIDKLTAQRKAVEDERDKLKDALTAAQKQTADEKASLTKTFTNDRDARFDVLTKEKTEAAKKAAEEKLTADKELGAKEKEIKEFKDKVAKLNGMITPVNFIDFDKARGKIVSLGRNGDVYINLGSADRVKPQLTFSIFPRDSNAKVTGERKAACEVMRVIAPHLSLARVVQVHDAAAQPVETGDQLFNPAWKPDEIQHIAISGLVDLSGDGTDNTMEFIRNLLRQNVVVDEYLDLKDLSVKGKMSLQTNYLIMGDAPEFNLAGLLREGDARTDRKKEIVEKMGEAQKEAARYGVNIIPARKFMGMIGYPLPRQSGPADYNLHPTTSVTGEPADTKEDTGKGEKAKIDKGDNGDKPKDMEDKGDKPEKPAPKGKPGKPKAKDMEDKGDDAKEMEDKGDKPAKGNKPPAKAKEKDKEKDKDKDQDK